MKTLKKFEFKAPGNRSQYDWSKLLDGGLYQITQGEDADFQGNVRNMIGRIKFKAAMRGQTVNVQVSGETDIVLQATSEPDAEKAATYKAHQKDLQAARKARGEAALAEVEAEG